MTTLTMTGQSAHLWLVFASFLNKIKNQACSLVELLLTDIDEHTPEMDDQAYYDQLWEGIRRQRAVHEAFLKRMEGHLAKYDAMTARAKKLVVSSSENLADC